MVPKEGCVLDMAVLVLVFAFSAVNGGRISGIGIELGCWYERL